MKNIKKYYCLIFVIAFSMLTVFNGISADAATNSKAAKHDIQTAVSCVLKAEKAVKTSDFNTKTALKRYTIAVKSVNEIKKYGQKYNTVYKSLNKRLKDVKLKIEEKIQEDKENSDPVTVWKITDVLKRDAVVSNTVFKKDLYIKADNVTLNNVKAEGTIFIDPGRNGTAVLNSVSAESIKVLSGGADGIHLNRTFADTLEICTDQGTAENNGTVRIIADVNTSIGCTTVTSGTILVSEGHMGTIEVNKGTNGVPPVVTLTGTFDDAVIANTSATIAAVNGGSNQPARVACIRITADQSNPVMISGKIDIVQITNSSDLTIGENSMIGAISASVPVAVKVAQTAMVSRILEGLTYGIYYDSTISFVTPSAPDNNSYNPGPVPQAVSALALNKTSDVLKVGDTEILTAAISPADAANKNISWISGNPGIVTVDSTGKITAVAEGTAAITCTSEDGNKTASCTVTVIIPVTYVSLDKSTDTILIGTADILTAAITPANATYKNISWTSSNPGIVAVDSTGKITAAGQGTATITCTTEDGSKTACCTVTVDDPVPVISVSLNKTFDALDYLINVKGTDTLTAVINPNNATDQKVSWSSSNSNIISVDNNGKITAVNEGNAIITCTTEDGAKSASCVVTATKSLEVITIDKFSTDNIEDHIDPSVLGCLEKGKLQWECVDNCDVVSITPEGNITVIKPGYTQINCYYADDTNSPKIPVFICLIHVLN